MAITNSLVRLSVGIVGVEPGILLLKTSLSSSQILVPGYLNQVAQSYGISVLPSDVLIANCSNGSGYYTLSVNGTGIITIARDMADISFNGIQIYVSKQIGNDGNDGSLTNPLATFNAAIARAGSPATPVQIIALDGATYNEQLVLDTSYIWINSPLASIQYTGAGDAITVTATGAGFPIILAQIGASSGNAIVNTSSEFVIVRAGSLLNGDIVNQGSAGAVIVTAEIVGVNFTNTSTGSIYYSIIARVGGIDSAGVTGISATSATGPFSIGGISYPIGPTTTGYVLTASGPNSAAFSPGGGGGLTPIASDTLLSNITGSSAIPVGNTLSAILDASFDNSQGDILYRGAGGWTFLAPGTEGQALITGGAAANPAWESGTDQTWTVGSNITSNTGDIISTTGALVSGNSTNNLTIRWTSNSSNVVSTLTNQPSNFANEWVLPHLAFSPVTLLAANLTQVDPMSNLIYFDTTVPAIALVGGASFPIANSYYGGLYRVRDLKINLTPTNFSGGDRDLLITDGSTQYSIIPAATLQALSNSLWGSVALPPPATTGWNTITAFSGVDLSATYINGTTDYAAGSITITVAWEKVS